MKFNFRGHSSQNLNGSQFSLPLSNRSFLGRSEGLPNQPKVPLLCLTLSTPSFLDCAIINAATNYPLYQIKTSSTTTTVMRRESVSSSVVASSIKWPKIIPMMRTKARAELVLVNMRDGPWRGGNSMLKPGSKNNSRKFRLPDYDNSLKWKLHGDLFLCTTPSVVGTIATLDPRRDNRPPRLTVYEDLYDESKPRQPLYGGVPILLLDYLIVTALLLVTDLQEWSLVPRSAYSRPESAADSPVWKEEAYPMANRAESSSSTIRTRPSSQNPSAGQAGPSHAHDHQRPYSSVHTHSDRDDEYISQWRRSLNPVSEAVPESFHAFHQPTSPSRGSPVPSPDSDNPHTLLPESTHGLATQSPYLPPHRNSVIPDDVGRNIFPSVLQRMELEREQNHSTSMVNNVRNPRPLPLTPTGHVSLPSSSLRSQHRSARILPSTSYAPCQLRVAPSFTSEVHSTLLDDPPSQNSQVVCPTDDVYGHQPITKASHVTQWLNSLTRDSSSAENALELLLRASILDSPPPPYNSVEFSSDQQRHGRQQVSSSCPPREGPLECQR